MSHENCPGLPHECAGALARLQQALNGRITSARAAEIRLQFEECQPCLVAYDIELKVHVELAEQCHEAAPAELADRIGQALARIDLDQVDVEDL